MNRPEADQRALELLAQMTIEEKAQQLTSVEPYGLMNVGPPTPDQLHTHLAGGIGHVAMYSMFQHKTTIDHVRSVNTIQRYLVEETRLGIPAIFHLEALNGVVAPDFTTFPTALSLASGWNPDGVQKMAAVSSRQARALGYVQALSPVMDVARDPRWGRVHETYGEDALLVSEMSVAFVQGMQGADLRHGTMATGKHFLGFAMSEGGQHMAATTASARELREVYARPFEAAIRHGLASVMNSYSTIDGVPVGANKAILSDLLRDDLGFDGTVVADYGTIANLVHRQGVARNMTEAAALALDAGLDVELPSSVAYGRTLARAVRDGRISEELLDRSAYRVLRDKFAAGLFDKPYVDEDENELAEIARSGTQLARDLARESIVLLSNDGTLPLSRGSIIALVGPLARSRGVAFPAYTYVGALGLMGAVDAGDSVKMAGLEDANSSLPEPARAALAAELTPQLSNGFEAYVAEHYGAENLAEALGRLDPLAQIIVAEGCGVLDGELDDIDAAVDAAQQADVVIIALGGRAGWFGDKQTEGEGSDQADVNLPDVQLQLVRRLAELGRPMVAVVFTGRPFALTELDDLVDTIVYAGYGGQFGVAAAAEALLGDVNPSGRLPISLPRHSGQIPLHVGQHLGSGYRRSPTDQHQRYNDMASTPLYPFGHGISYTTFSYSDFVTQSEMRTDGTLTAQITVTNSGKSDGTEVVQFYVSHRASVVTRPAQQLVAFARVTLKPGESRNVSVAVSTGQIAYLGAAGSFEFEATALEVQVGSSSAEIHARATVQVSGPSADWSRDRPLSPTVLVC